MQREDSELFKSNDILEYTTPERKRPNYIIAILPLLLVLILAGIILVISLIIYPNLRDDNTNNEDAEANLIFYFQISDLHIDLSYSSTTLPLGAYGIDSGTLLLNRTLEAMKLVNDDPEFILLTGDIVAHNRKTSQEQFATIYRATKIIEEYYPNTTVYPALGNNDVFPDYYYAINTTTPWMSNLTALWSVWLNSDQQSTFKQYGYYKVNSTWEGGPVMLVLNSLIYSSYLVDTSIDANATSPTPPSELPDDPNGQFAWITNELELARSNSLQVVFQYHIPPGVNSYDGSEQWHDKFTYQFYNICSTYSDVILFHNAAHYHTDDFRLFGNTTILLNPSISPDHHNNPTFRQYIAKGSSVINYVQYYTDLVASNLNEKNNKTVTFPQEYSLQSVYGVDDVSFKSFQYIFNLISTSTPHYIEYFAHKYAYYAYQRDELLCAVGNANLTKYDTCLSYIPDDE